MVLLIKMVHILITIIKSYNIYSTRVLSHLQCVIIHYFLYSILYLITNISLACSSTKILKEKKKRLMCLLLLWITFTVNKAASIALHISYSKRQISVGVLFCCFLCILKRDCPDRQECRFLFTLWCCLYDLKMSFSILAVARGPSSDLVCTDIFFSCLQTHGTQIRSFLMRVSKERINLLWQWLNVGLQHTIWDHNVSLKCTFWILRSSSLWSSFTGQRQCSETQVDLRFV